MKMNERVKKNAYTPERLHCRLQSRLQFTFWMSAWILPIWPLGLDDIFITDKGREGNMFMFTATPSAPATGGGGRKPRTKAKAKPTAQEARKRRAAAAARSNRMAMTGGGCDGSSAFFSPATPSGVFVGGIPFAETGVGGMENLNPVLSAYGAGGSTVGPFSPVVMYDAGGMGPVPGSLFSTGTPSFQQQQQHGGAAPVRRRRAAATNKKKAVKKSAKSGSSSGRAAANKKAGKK